MHIKPEYAEKLKQRKHKLSETEKGYDNEDSKTKKKQTSKKSFGSQFHEGHV